MAKRPTVGAGLFYTRDSGGRHETTPGEYVRWAQREATRHGVIFTGTPAQIEAMIRDGRSQHGDLYLDYGVTSNQLSRVGLDALIKRALADHNVSHVFIPRRDRFARPDDPVDGVKLESLLSHGGLTLIFSDRVVQPVAHGRRRDVGELILAMVDYNAAGEFRHELAQKMLNAQLNLARAGFSTGGRAPYGFRRWLARADGTPVRQLSDGEYVKMAGHHVVWWPGPEEELEIIRRIITMLETMPASRVAAALTAEGIPAPDAGRHRTDGGVRHATSGVWHQTTIINIARNPLLLAIVSYGRRSMGDRLRFDPGGPRHLDENDRREDGKPKVVANPESRRIVADARFEPLVDSVRHQRLLGALDDRAGTQRGKARSRTPGQNPLGSRIFDMGCGWPMYRQPYNGTFRYLCGFYQQSHGAECRHNAVDGMAASRFLLACIRQRVLAPDMRTRLEAKLRAIAERERETKPAESVVATQQAKLADVRRKRERAAKNLALAESEEQRRAVAAVFDELVAEERALEAKLRQAEAIGPTRDIDADVASALGVLDRMGELAADPTNLESIGTLFAQLNARLFLRFEEAQLKKRRVNRVSGGVVTFGSSPPPVALYEGPTGRRALQSEPAIPGPAPRGVALPGNGGDSARENNSLGNVSRGERI